MPYPVYNQNNTLQNWQQVWNYAVQQCQAQNMQMWQTAAYSQPISNWTPSAFQTQPQQTQPVQPQVAETPVITPEMDAEARAYVEQAAQQYAQQNPVPLDGKDDGKISFGQKMKNFGKGCVKFFTNMVTDKNGKFSIGKTLTTAAIVVGTGILCVATAGTAVPVVLATVGAGAAAIGVGKSAYKAATAKTDAEAAAAWQGMGSNTVALGLSVTGMKGAMKGYNAANKIKADYSGIRGTFRAVGDAGKVTYQTASKAVTNVRNGYAANGVKGAWGSVAKGCSNLKTTMATNMKKYYNANQSIERIQQKDLESYRNQFKEANKIRKECLDESGNIKPGMEETYAQYVEKARIANQQYNTVKRAYSDMKISPDVETATGEIQARITRIEAINKELNTTGLDNNIKAALLAELDNHNIYLNSATKAYNMRVTNFKDASARLAAQEKSLNAKQAAYDAIADKSSQAAVEQLNSINALKAKITQTRAEVDAFKVTSTAAKRKALIVDIDAKIQVATAANDANKLLGLNNAKAIVQTVDAAAAPMTAGESLGFMKQVYVKPFFGNISSTPGARPTILAYAGNKNVAEADYSDYVAGQLTQEQMEQLYNEYINAMQSASYTQQGSQVAFQGNTQAQTQAQGSSQYNPYAGYSQMGQQYNPYAQAFAQQQMNTIMNDAASTTPYYFNMFNANAPLI